MLFLFVYIMFVLFLFGVSGISLFGLVFFLMIIVINLIFLFLKLFIIFLMLFLVLIDFWLIIIMIIFLEFGCVFLFGWKNRYFVFLRVFIRLGELLGNLVFCIRVNKDFLLVFWNGKIMLDF